MEFQIYDTRTLIGVMREMAPVSNYWLNLCFPTEMTFEDEYIEFEKVYESRKMAPFVAPTAQGVPIWSEGSDLTRMKPAYIKPRDPVTPHRQIRRKPGELGLPTQLTPAQRWDLAVADIMRTHREAIERRLEWMAAQAVIHAHVTIKGDNYPERYVDFKRDPSLTITLGAGESWDNAGVNILQQLTSTRNAARRLPFGGPFNRLTLGAEATEMFLANDYVRDELNTDRRGTSVDVNTGLREGLDAEYLGTLGAGMQVWSYSDYYQDTDGSVKEFLDPRDAVLTGDVGGVQAFGAILDKKAGLRAMRIFPKMWDVEDPSATNCMSQSAPMMIPTLPNRSARIRVAS